MLQLSILKQKLNSIKTTKKITHAIRLISMSFYSRLEKQSKYLNNYQKTITQIFSQLLSQETEWKHSRLFPQDIMDTNPLFIIISSAKGLCGSFNGNLFRYFERTFLLEKHQVPTFITIGQKATKFITELKNVNIIYKQKELSSSNFSNISKEISKIILENKTIYSSVTFYHNYFKNFFIQKPQKTTLTPINLQSLTHNNSTSSSSKDLEQKISDYEDLIWEQDKNTIINYVAKRFIISSTFNILFQSLISENASRFIAMDNSTTNAEKYIERLTLQYNKSRQTLITREVAELSVNLTL